MQIIYGTIIILALWGLKITLKIYKKKKSAQPFTCMLGADCKTVITSEFSSFLGIGLEVFGVLYYGLIAMTYLTLLLIPALATPWTVFVLLGVTTGAFLFSLYLTFVQAVYIKSWCSWCLTSAGISTVIFFLTILGVVVANIDLIPILEILYAPILILHLLGFALGVGGATASDVLFLRFLKDFKISRYEDKILKIMSQVIWGGLFLAIISGVGLFIPNAEELQNSGKFLAKVVIVTIITLNGALLNLLISPMLVKISFKDSMHVSKTHKLRKVAFGLGAVSFVSWYSAFILGSLKNVTLNFGEILSIYLAVLFVAIIVSQIFEYKLCSKKD